MDLTPIEVCDKDVPVYEWVNGEKKQTGTKKCGTKAKDAKDDIDIDAIITKCDEIKGYAETVESIGSQVNICAELITTDKLSINGTGVEGLVTDYNETSTKQAQNIRDLADQTKEDAIAAFNAKQATYNKQKSCGHNS